jgi:hypothetical protein
MKLFDNLNLLWAFGYFGLFYLLLKYLGNDISLQGYIALGLILIALLREIFLWIAKKIGGKVELEENELLRLVDEGIDAIRKNKKSKDDISQLEQELKNRVQSKKIKSINDIIKSIGELTK